MSAKREVNEAWRLRWMLWTYRSGVWHACRKAESGVGSVTAHLACGEIVPVWANPIITVVLNMQKRRDKATNRRLRLCRACVAALEASGTEGGLGGEGDEA